MGSIRRANSLELKELKNIFCVTLKLSERIEIGRKLQGQRLKGDRTDPTGNTDLVENNWSYKMVLSVAERLGELRIE